MCMAINRAQVCSCTQSPVLKKCTQWVTVGVYMHISNNLLMCIKGFLWVLQTLPWRFYFVNSSPAPHSHRSLLSLFQPVWIPLYHSLCVSIISGFQAQLNWLIKSEHVPPAQCFQSIIFLLCFLLCHTPRPGRSVHTSAVWWWTCAHVCARTA